MTSVAALVALLAAPAPPAPDTFPWPGGARAALSLSFDDARQSQVDTGLAVLDAHGVKVTFFVVPGAVEERLEGWKRAVSAGHEIGNHSLIHPCSGNFAFARHKALEGYTYKRMRRELRDASARVKALLGVTPQAFAYPCGQTFVGSGRRTRSYVPAVAEMFVAGRGWRAEVPHDPRAGDLAQVMGVEMDGKDFEEIRPLLDQARETGGWLVLGGHEIGEGGRQTTRVAMLRQLLPYVLDGANGFWVAPVGTVARHVRGSQRRIHSGASGRGRSANARAGGPRSGTLPKHPSEQGDKR
jgi:peptidoglycan/xylan/chitin deacetylase (PgdA/CDA1 family)